MMFRERPFLYTALPLEAKTWCLLEAAKLLIEKTNLQLVHYRTASCSIHTYGEDSC